MVKVHLLKMQAVLLIAFAIQAKIYNGKYHNFMDEVFTEKRTLLLINGLSLTLLNNYMS